MSQLNFERERTVFGPFGIFGHEEWQIKLPLINKNCTV